ncbi:MAG: hypothetical protein IJR66_00820 [Clostridia bacterium]|nr:hypothetical protein [Clostridia bacterium]
MIIGKKLELKKRKYKKLEVKELLDNNAKEYESILFEQKDKISELIADNKKLQSEVLNYQDKDSQVFYALNKAKSVLDENEKEVNFKYDAEINKIKNFSKKFRDYFTLIMKTYPVDKELDKIQKVLNELDLILSEKVSSSEKYAKINGLIDTKPAVKTKKSGKDSENAVASDNGFDLNEVLYPKDLKLEEICKELGLIGNE